MNNINMLTHHLIFPLLHNFQATSGSEYGEVLCWASNNLGEQRTPCVFHVMPLGTPQPPSECEVVQGLAEKGT